jgi:hypothetical protein
MIDGDASINLSVQHLEFTSNRLQRATDASEKVASPVNEASLRPGACSLLAEGCFVCCRQRKMSASGSAFGCFTCLRSAKGAGPSSEFMMSQPVGCIGFTGKRS